VINEDEAEAAKEKERQEMIHNIIVPDLIGLEFSL